MTENTLIAVEGLTHRYGGRTALQEVSFTVEAGETFGLLGPNGGGKTTVFRILATLLPPTAGKASIFGEDVARAPHQIRKRIGVVFQSQSLDRKLTAWENLRHQGHLYGLRGKVLRSRVQEMLARVGLADRSHEIVEKLSDGLRRRVELAKGLLHRPDLLLLDEPTTGLDPGARRDFGQQLRDLKRQDGVTILLTTHFMEEAERCDRLGILDRGKLVAIGSPQSLKARIGGDVVVLETGDPEKLRRQVEEKFRAQPIVIGETVRLEHERGHEFITQLVEAFPGQIDAVTVAKPTLEDVFIHQTGHRFWSEGPGADNEGTPQQVAEGCDNSVSSQVR